MYNTFTLGCSLATHSERSRSIDVLPACGGALISTAGKYPWQVPKLGNPFVQFLTCLGASGGVVAASNPVVAKKQGDVLLVCIGMLAMVSIRNDTHTTTQYAEAVEPA